MNSTPALTILQPWAELVVAGRKSIELRSWAPEHRGRLWIHVGLRALPDLDKHFELLAPYRGGYIGSVKVSAVVPMTAERWNTWRERHLDLGPYPGELLAWILQEPRRFRLPVPGSGQLGLFSPTGDIAQRLDAAEMDALAATDP